MTPGLTIIQRVGLCLLDADGPMLLSEIMAATGINRTRVAVSLNTLCEVEIVEARATRARARKFVIVDRDKLRARVAMERQRDGAISGPRYDFGPLIAAVGGAP